MTQQPGKTLDLMGRLNGPVTERELMGLVFEREVDGFLLRPLTPECGADKSLSVEQEKRAVREAYISMRLDRMQSRARLDFWIQGMRGKYTRSFERER